MKLKLPDAPLASELRKLYPETFSSTQGVPCRWRQTRRAGYSVTKEEDGALRIEYGGTDDLTLALGDLMALGKPAAISKTAPYEFRGIMLDVSRNGVVKKDFLKERIARLALLGLNRFCLYTEDVYAVPGEPLFGYARGRYADEDIRELVAYGRIFGVTLFPCIQTLGHMEHILKYPRYNDIKDNDMVYNVYAKGVYEFIAKTIDAAVAPYDTDLIHVGMDETFGLGRGLAFKEGEPIHPRKLYVDHVRKVAEICRRKGLKPVMWGDIVLGGAGEEGMGKDLTRRLPKDMAMNYWNYAHCDVKKYAADIGTYRKMGFEPTLSPGTWTWSRFFPAYYKAESNIGTLLDTGRKLGVKKALLTHWGDDGHECLFDFNLPAHAYFLAQCTEDKNIGAAARKKFAAVFQADFDALRSTEKIDLAGYKSKSLLPINVGKCFLYDDPAQGLFSGQSFVKPAASFYKATGKLMAKHARKAGPFQAYFAFAQAFCEFLEVKSDLRRRAAAAYKKKDQAAVKRIVSDIAEAQKRLTKVHRLYRVLWLSERSPFGLEIIEGRLGTIANRLDYLAHILREFLAGRMPRLEELDFPHYSMFYKSSHHEYQPAIWPELMLHYSALASRNTIKWW